jgi:site-specific DNA-methyltransferase (adenine-specific)
MIQENAQPATPVQHFVPLPFGPYYEGSGIKIYNADCRKVLPWLERFDLLLTDPPYGIGRDGSRPSTSKHGGRKAYEFQGWDSETPPDYVLQMCLDSAKEHVVWGANYFPKVFDGSMGWLVWDKGQDICSSDCELAYSSRKAALRRLVLNRVALMKDGTTHPTQKPVALMRWCLSLFEDAKTIVDPFMGSGTTLVAAKLEGREAVGIEMNERYCESDAKRLSQGTLF